MPRWNDAVCSTWPKRCRLTRSRIASCPASGAHTAVSSPARNSLASMLHRAGPSSPYRLRASGSAMALPPPEQPSEHQCRANQPLSRNGHTVLPTHSAALVSNSLLVISSSQLSLYFSAILDAPPPSRSTFRQREAVLPPQATRRLRDCISPSVTAASPGRARATPSTGASNSAMPCQPSPT